MRAFQVGQLVRFTKSSKEWGFKKGQTDVVEDVSRSEREYSLKKFGAWISHQALESVDGKCDCPFCPGCMK